MTSKLRRTIVGVGIALGGAAPGCFGRTQMLDDSPSADTEDETTVPLPDARAPEPSPTDAGPPDRSDATDADTTLDAMPDATPDATPGIDGGLDASSDGAVDPFCDVSWPPTKGTPSPGRVPCVDPLHECAGAYPPYRCFKLVAPFHCDGEALEGPLYCIGGEWRCPPGADDGMRCRCWGTLPAGQSCTDAGLTGVGGSSSSPEGGQGAN